ncbi:MAG: flotillin family protein [Planctomycetota bacterium]
MTLAPHASLLPTIAQEALFDGLGILILITIVIAILVGFAVFFVRRYRRCPPNRILVVYGKSGGAKTAKCYHGGAAFILPVFQDFAYLSLEPMTIDIELTSALSKKNIRVAVPSTFTVAISTAPEIMQNAAERLLGLREQERSHFRPATSSSARCVW